MAKIPALIKKLKTIQNELYFAAENFERRTHNPGAVQDLYYVLALLDQASETLDAREWEN